MSLPIVHYNDPVLRKKGNKVTVFDTALQRFAHELIESMHEAGGIGLAAQQVGRAVQVCVVDLRETESEYIHELDGGKPPPDIFMPLVLVNPVVTLRPSAKPTVYEEGCLSFPEIRGDVARVDDLSVAFQDEYGLSHVLRSDGLLARCVLHEVDHLNGVLFIDRMEKKVRAGLDERVKALARRTREGKSPPAASKPPS